MTHAAHRMHENSLDAHRSDIENFGHRAQIIYDYIRVFGPATDRQVMSGLGFTDMNACRPRISELLQHGLLIEVDDITDPITRKRVRRVQVAPQTPQLNLL